MYDRLYHPICINLISCVLAYAVCPLQPPCGIHPPPPPRPRTTRLPSLNGMAALAASFSSSTGTPPPLHASSSTPLKWTVPCVGPQLGVRGGGGRDNGALSLSAAAMSSTDATVEAPVEKFRKDYQAPGHWTRSVEGRRGGDGVEAGTNIPSIKC